MYKFEVLENYIQITSNLEINATSQIDLLKDVSEFAVKSNCSKVLVDLREAPINLSLMDHKTGADSFLKYCKGLKVAFVFPDVLENYKFGENVAYNLGGDISLFASVGKAKEWLMKE